MKYQKNRWNIALNTRGARLSPKPSSFPMVYCTPAHDTNQFFGSKNDNFPPQRCSDGRNRWNRPGCQRKLGPRRYKADYSFRRRPDWSGPQDFFFFKALVPVATLHPGNSALAEAPTWGFEILLAKLNYKDILGPVILFTATLLQYNLLTVIPH